MADYPIHAPPTGALVLHLLNAAGERPLSPRRRPHGPGRVRDPRHQPAPLSRLRLGRGGGLHRPPHHLLRPRGAANRVRASRPRQLLSLNSPGSYQRGHAAHGHRRGGAGRLPRGGGGCAMSMDNAQRANNPSKGGREQQNGLDNALDVQRMIRTLIHEHGHNLHDGDTVRCYPMQHLAVSVRQMLLLDERTSQSLTLIRDNIATWTAPLPGAPFMVDKDDEGVECIFEPPKMRSEPPRETTRVRGHATRT